MVRRTLGVDDGLELADDAADALALAICHLFRARFPRAEARPRRPLVPAQVRP
jgi:Holliday junction resolvasome RuvABC endonuclease subunit